MRGAFLKIFNIGVGSGGCCINCSFKMFIHGTRSSILIYLQALRSRRRQSAQQAKADLNVQQFQIPCRSPDLNVMDFYVWSEVERRLRMEERTWHVDHQESRDEVIQRLQRTIRTLPKASIDWAIVNLALRARALQKAKGGLFEEGGRRGRLA